MKTLVILFMFTFTASNIDVQAIPVVSAKACSQALSVFSAQRDELLASDELADAGVINLAAACVKVGIPENSEKGVDNPL